MENLSIQNSRVANIADMQKNLKEIVGDIRRGREVVLTEYDRVIARIIPFSDSEPPEKWPDFSQRAIAIFGKPPESAAVSGLAETREERF